jgi:hypothetical protein
MDHVRETVLKFDLCVSLFKTVNKVIQRWVLFLRTAVSRGCSRNLVY